MSIRSKIAAALFLAALATSARADGINNPGCTFGTAAGTCAQGNDSRFTPNPPQFTSFSTPGATTYTIPSWANTLDVWTIGAGGGGGSGARRATGGIRTGGGGGAGGAASRQRFPVSVFGGAGAVIPVYVGSGGAGGAAISADTTNGNAGQSGHACGIGAVWDYVSTTSTNSFNGIGQNSGTFVAVGGAGVLFTSSSPSTSWTSQTSNAGGNQLNTVIFAGGSINLWVAVGNGGTIITSPDAVTWTSRTSGTANNLSDIMFDGTTLVAVGNSGTILTSTDGTSWATNAFASANNIVQIDHNGTSRYVAVDNAGNTISATNPTGTWTSASLVSGGFLGGIAFNGSNLWVIVANNGVIYTSPDGSNWTSRGVKWAQTSNNEQITFVNGYFFFSMFVSSDGINWFTPLATSLSSGPKGVQYESATGNYYFSWPGVTAPAGPIGILATVGGNIPTYAFGIPAASNNGGGAGGTSNAAAGSATTNAGQFLGSAGGASSSTAAAGSGGANGASGGGGGGGSADASNSNRAPAAGGQSSAMAGVRYNAGVAGTAGGNGPGPSLNSTGSQIIWGAAGGSGGAFNASTIGQKGANGGNPGGGGGGGAATDNGTNSGAGGDGGKCEVRLTAYQ